MSVHAHMKSLIDGVIPKGLLLTPFHNNEHLLRTYCVSGEHGGRAGNKTGMTSCCLIHSASNDQVMGALKGEA